MRAQLASRHDVVDPLSIWAERDGRARLVLTDDLGLCWSNKAADRFIAQSGLFQRTRDRLVLREARRLQVFQQFIRSSGAEASTLCIPCAGDEHILCAALSLGGDGAERTTGLTLRRATGEVALIGMALRSAFNLTASEQRIVETMFAGRTAEEVGADLGVAIGTVRVHIRHIYEKLEVASREAMFHKLVPFLLVD